MNSLNRGGNLFESLESGMGFQSIMRQVYVWMGLGTLLTAVTAYATVNNSVLANLAANPAVFMAAILAELGLVLGLSFGFNRMSANTASILFFVYAGLNGFTLSMVLLAYTTGSVVGAFVATSALFGAMSIIGYTTKMDLTKMGTYLMMGVIGLVIAMVVNMFLSNGPMDMLISIIGVLIFTGLTAYDTQRIRKMAAGAAADRDSAMKLSVFGALRLYLDFINMFLFILRLSGRRR